VLEAVFIDGPEQVTGGERANFQAVAAFSDDSEEDVTGAAVWMAAPPELASIERGLLSSTQVDNIRQATLVATYTQLTSAGEISRTGAKVIRIVADQAGGGAGRCGVGMLVSVPALLLPLVRMWRRRN
jgi:hypothetical protein